MWASPAWAYIPPSEYLVKTMAQKKSGLHSLRIRGNVIGLTAEGGLSGAKFTEETIVDLQGGTMRSLALDDSGRELYSTERSLKKTSTNREPWSLVSGLIFESQPAALVRLLKRWDVPVKEESELLKLPDEKERQKAEMTFFARQKRASGLQISWVIGEKSSSQLWIEKDTFLPVKIILKSSDGVEVGFENYRLTKDIPFPRLLTLHRGSAPVFREEVVDLVVNTPDLAQNKRSSLEGFTDAGDSADNETRELIRRYFSLVR